MWRRLGQSQGRSLFVKAVASRRSTARSPCAATTAVSSLTGSGEPGKYASSFSSTGDLPRRNATATSRSPYQGSATCRFVARRPGATTNPVPATRARKLCPAAGHVINPADVSDRLPCVVHCRRRKRLLPFQVRHLARELVHLLLQPASFRRSVVVRHHYGAEQRQHAQQPLHKPLPGLNHFAIPTIFRNIGIEHEPSGPARREIPG